MEMRALERGVRAAPALVPPAPHAQPCEPRHAGLRWADPTCSSLISTRTGDGVPSRRVRLGTTCVCSAPRDDRADEKVSASRFASAPPPWTAAQARGARAPCRPHATGSAAAEWPAGPSADHTQTRMLSPGKPWEGLRPDKAASDTDRQKLH